MCLKREEMKLASHNISTESIYIILPDNLANFIGHPAL